MGISGRASRPPGVRGALGRMCAAGWALGVVTNGAVDEWISCQRAG